MTIQIKETQYIDSSTDRLRWIRDPEIQSYVTLQDVGNSDRTANTLPNFQRYYEIFYQDEHVGDIKVYYDCEADIFDQRAQILMVVGERNQGIGTEALRLLIREIKDYYRSVYCIIDRTNIASLKILKRNGFSIEQMDEDTIRLMYQF